ncbi:hypothetical protein JZ751_022200, partial [Albula glossodonta]
MIKGYKETGMKRILASLGDRLHDDIPQKPGRAISLREPIGNHTPPQLSPSLGYTSSSLDVQHLMMQADARRRRNDAYFDDVPRSKLERQMAQVSMVSITAVEPSLNIAYPRTLELPKSSTLKERSE